jgi:hypothetical protein
MKLKLKVKMTKPTPKIIGTEIDKAIIADEQANASYYNAIEGFKSARLTKANTNVDNACLKELDSAWIAKESTGKNLRKAYMKLYDLNS